MKKSNSSFAFASALAALTLTLANSLAEPVATVPVACMDYPVTTGVKRSFGVPLFDLPIVTGFASAVTPNSISVANVNWTANQFAVAGKAYFVTIRTGAEAGRTLLVTGNTANTLTLDVGDSPLNTAGFAVTAGTDSVELFQGDTLASLFGSVADGAGFLSSGLKGGTVSSNSDTVQVFDGSTSVIYYFNTTLGTWLKNNGASIDESGIILYPDEGMIINRRGPTGNLTFSGRVPSTRLLTQFSGGTTSYTSIRFPADTTLGGLNFGAPGTWLAGSSANDADTVALWNGSNWNTYYKNLNNQWVSSNGNSGDQSSLAIPAGQAIRVVKRGSASGAAGYFSQPLPYGL